MIETKREDSPTIPLRFLAAGLVLAYVAAIILFYFLAGEQLHLRNSRGDIELFLRIAAR